MYDHFKTMFQDRLSYNPLMINEREESCLRKHMMYQILYDPIYGLDFKSAMDKISLVQNDFEIYLEGRGLRDYSLIDVRQFLPAGTSTYLLSGFDDKEEGIEMTNADKKTYAYTYSDLITTYIRRVGSFPFGAFPKMEKYNSTGIYLRYDVDNPAFMDVLNVMSMVFYFPYTDISDFRGLVAYMQIYYYDKLWLEIKQPSYGFVILGKCHLSQTEMIEHFYERKKLVKKCIEKYDSFTAISLSNIGAQKKYDQICIVYCLDRLIVVLDSDITNIANCKYRDFRREIDEDRVFRQVYINNIIVPKLSKAPYDTELGKFFRHAKDPKAMKDTVHLSLYNSSFNTDCDIED